MKKYYIKERFNMQTGTYYVPMGRMTKTAAQKAARPLYGTNTLHAFDSVAAYEARIAELKASGKPTG